MKEIIYSKDIELDSETKIFLDSSFLVALVDEEDYRNSDSNELAEILKQNDCKLYINNIVLSEVIQTFIYKFFINDIQDYAKDVYMNLTNTKNNLKQILGYIDEEDIEILKSKNQRLIDKINYKKYFNYIYKYSNEKHILKYYFNNAVQIYKSIENYLKYSFIQINDGIIELAKRNVPSNMLNSNDAQHLATAYYKNMDYLLTLDKDFSNVRENKKYKLSILKLT